MAEQWTWWQKSLFWECLYGQTSGSIKSHWHHFQWSLWNNQQVVWLKPQISVVIRKGLSLTRSRNRLQSSLLVQSMVQGKEKTVMSSCLSTWTVDGFFLLNRVLNICVLYQLMFVAPVHTSMELCLLDLCQDSGSTLTFSLIVESTVDF